MLEFKTRGLKDSGVYIVYIFVLNFKLESKPKPKSSRPALYTPSVEFPQGSSTLEKERPEDAVKCADGFQAKSMLPCRIVLQRLVKLLPPGDRVTKFEAWAEKLASESK